MNYSWGNSLAFLFALIKLTLFLNQLLCNGFLFLLCLLNFLVHLLLAVAHEHLAHFLLLFLQVTLEFVILGLAISLCENLFLNLLGFFGVDFTLFAAVWPLLFIDLLIFRVRELF